MKRPRLIFTVFFAAFLTAVAGVIAWNSVSRYGTAVSASTKQIGFPILTRASGMIDGDKFEALTKTLDDTDPWYIETRGRLNALRIESGCLYLYTMATLPDGTHRFIIDGDDSAYAAVSGLGEIEDTSEYSDAYFKAYETGEAQSDTRNQTSKWGSLLSVYQPIFNSAGKVVGVIGCDFDAAGIYEDMYGSTMRLVLIVILFGAAAFIPMFWLVSKLSKTAPEQRGEKHTASGAVAATKTRVVSVSAVVFIVLAVISAFAFATSMRNVNRSNAESRLVSVLKTLKLGLSQSVNGELALALKMADTAVIKDHFESPGDEALKAAAFKEFESFAAHFASRLVFWVSDADKKYYTQDGYQYTVDARDPDSYWYNGTLYGADVFNLNINYDEHMNVFNLWINLPVFSAEGHKPLGVLGTGISLREFTDIMHELGKSPDGKIDAFVFNGAGEIVAAENYELVTQRSHINDRLGVDVIAAAKNLPPDGIYTFSRGNTLYCVYAVPELGWYAAGSLAVSAFWANDPMLNYLFIILIAVILAIMVVFNVFIAKYTDYINMQSESLVESQKKENEAKTDAQEAEQEKEEFIDGISKFVRESVGEIIGALKLVSLGGGVSEDAQRLIDEASAEGRSLLHRFEGNGETAAEGLGHIAHRHAAGGKKHAESGTHHFFVINPKSFYQGTELKNFLLSVEKCFSVGHRAEYKIYISRYPRDASAAVHRYLSSVPENETVRVYAVGGDGIAFDCLNGMSGFNNCELAAIPYGNSNDICRAFGMSHFNEFRDIKLMSRSTSRPMDIIECGRLRAVANCSIGIEGLAVFRFAKLIEYLNGGRWRRFVPLLYKLGAIMSLLDGTAKPPEYRITIDGEVIVGRFTVINVGNIALNGGGNTPNPLAVPNDGLLDVLISANFKTVQALKAIPKYTSGRYAEMPKSFRHSRCREFTCESGEQMCVVLDGETFFTNQITLKVSPGGVKIVSPGGIGFKDFSGGLQ